MIGWLAPPAQRFRFLPEGQGSAGLLPWVIAVMVFLTALAIAGGTGLSKATSGLTEALGRTVTVQIVEANPDLRAAQAKAAEALLRRTPGVVRVEPFGEEATRQLLEPWLGEGNVTDDLPLPAMIDAELGQGRDIDLETLGARVKAVAPAARLDDHARWLGPLAGLVEALQGLSIIIVGLVAAATVAVVALGTRSGLNIYRPTIEVLHMMGAEDAMIARIFQYRYAIHGFVGGMVGLACALVVLYLVGRFAEALGGGLIGGIGLPWFGWLLLALLPFAAALLTMVTARMTVARALADYL